jgi:voltage-dependent potassium channel beta subunit
MQYRFLGKSGLKVSALSFGSWTTFASSVDVDLAYDLMVKAWDNGVNFFDNAEVYANGHSEIIMGKALRRAGWKRSDYVISTKIFWGGSGPNDNGLSRKHIIEGTDAALKRLDLEYVDLIYCHRPDLYTPIEETVWAMNHIINQGKAFYWGTSEWSASQIMEAYHIARREHLIPPLMEQPEYNMFNRFKIEMDYLSLYTEIGLGTTIWSPLASGILTNKYANGFPEGSRLSMKENEWLKKRFETAEGQEKIKKATKLQSISDNLDMTLAQMSIAWCLKNPHVSTVITGATKLSQLEENLKSLELVPRLTPDVMDQIEHVLKNKPLAPQDWRP